MTATAEDLVRVARAAGIRIAVAESCTGGQVAAALSAVPGASACFWGGAVVYSPAAKQALTGLSAEQLQRTGTVSADCSAALARAVRERAGVELGLAVTGWAGPEGDDVGAVFLAVDAAGWSRQASLRVPGSRQGVRAAATQALLELTLAALREGSADR